MSGVRPSMAGGLSSMSGLGPGGLLSRRPSYQVGHGDLASGPSRQSSIMSMVRGLGGCRSACLKQLTVQRNWVQAAHRAVANQLIERADSTHVCTTCRAPPGCSAATGHQPVCSSCGPGPAASQKAVQSAAWLGTPQTTTCWQQATAAGRQQWRCRLLLELQLSLGRLQRAQWVSARLHRGSRAVLWARVP